MKQRKKKLAVLAIVVAMTCAVSACANISTINNSYSEQENETGQADTTSTDSQVIDLSKYKVEYTDRDTNTDWQSEEQTVITGQSDDITVTGQGITLDENTITITEAGTYVFSGTFDEKNIVVNAADCKIRIVLNGVTISNTSNAPVTIEDSKKVVITLADGTENIINDNRQETDEDAEEKAAIFSKEDITFQGNGSLEINSSENSGIKSKDGLIFMSGEYTINAMKNGITGKDYVVIADGTFSISTQKNGIRATNDTDDDKGFVWIENGTITIESGEDGIVAKTLTYIEDGTIDITSGGGNENGVAHNEEFGMMPGGPDMSASGEMPNEGMPGGEAPNGRMPGGETPNGEKPFQNEQEQQSDEDSTSKKGIKAGEILYIANGNITCDSADDALHCNGDVYISDGNIKIKTGDDGIHADDTLNIYQGDIAIEKSYEGLEGLNINIYGGNIDITASDDGINGNGASEEFMPPNFEKESFSTEETSETDSEKSLEESDSEESEETSVLTISGGTIHINADGDGLDSNGKIVQTGGDIIIDGCENGGNGAIDYDDTYVMTGGSLLAIGASGMWQTIDDSSTIYCATAVFDSTFDADTTVTISVDGNEIISYQSEKSFNAVSYAGCELKSGDEVTIKVGSQEKTTTINSINTQM